MNSYKNFVTIQSPISIPLTLHLDVASRHMKFQKTVHSCKHDSRFSSISHGSENGQTVYNAERLLAEIRVLKNVRAPHFFLSHSEPFQQNKEDVLEWMEAIYEKRKRDESYIKTPQRL